MTWLKPGRVYKLTKDNLAKTPNSAGNYTLYNKQKRRFMSGPRKATSVQSGGTKKVNVIAMD